jgi:hypothetical protein
MEEFGGIWMLRLLNGAFWLWQHRTDELNSLQLPYTDIKPTSHSTLTVSGLAKD